VAINSLIYGGFLLIGLLSWFIWDKRYRSNHGADIPKGYLATEEVFIVLVRKYKLTFIYFPAA